MFPNPKTENSKYRFSVEYNLENNKKHFEYFDNLKDAEDWKKYYEGFYFLRTGEIEKVKD